MLEIDNDMRQEKPAILIVGADSLIGSTLMNYCSKAGENVVGTTRRISNIDPFHLYLDLSKDFAHWHCPYPVKVAVICAGVTKLKECQNNPDIAERVNVTGITTLTKKLLDEGIFVVFLSTNYVFDGSQPYRKENDAVSPVTEYGKQKAETERQLLAMGGDSVAIIRFTKVLSDKTDLLLQWRSALARQEKIYPFQNVCIAPISLSCAINAIYKIAQKKCPGIFHVSPDREISYFELASIGANILGIDKNLIKPIDCLSSNYAPGYVLKYSTLGTVRLSKEIDFKIDDVEKVVDTAFCLLRNETYV